MPIGASTFRPWASAKFVGARHIFPGLLAAGDGKAVGAALQSELSANERCPVMSSLMSSSKTRRRQTRCRSKF